MTLGAVVAIAIGGRAASPVPAGVSSNEPVIALASLPLTARIRPAPPAGMEREEGTDGLMGRLPFGLVGDTPLIRIDSAGAGERINRFTIDDRVVGWSGLDTTPPWVRRMGSLSGYVTDPYER